jgi:hypothetical protein
MQNYCNWLVNTGYFDKIESAMEATDMIKVLILALLAKE